MNKRVQRSDSKVTADTQNARDTQSSQPNAQNRSGPLGARRISDQTDEPIIPDIRSVAHHLNSDEASSSSQRTEHKQIRRIQEAEQKETEEPTEQKETSARNAQQSNTAAAVDRLAYLTFGSERPKNKLHPHHSVSVEVYTQTHRAPHIPLISSAPQQRFTPPVPDTREREEVGPSRGNPHRQEPQISPIVLSNPPPWFPSSEQSIYPVNFPKKLDRSDPPKPDYSDRESVGSGRAPSHASQQLRILPIDTTNLVEATFPVDPQRGQVPRRTYFPSKPDDRAREPVGKDRDR